MKLYLSDDIQPTTADTAMTTYNPAALQSGKIVLYVMLAIIMLLYTPKILRGGK